MSEKELKKEEEEEEEEANNGTNAWFQIEMNEKF